MRPNRSLEKLRKNSEIDIFFVFYEAHPGPACYRKGGPLTVTDANLVLGRLLPEYFPKIFGPNENEPLDYAITRKKFEELQKEINAFLIESGQRTVKLLLIWPNNSLILSFIVFIFNFRLHSQSKK